MEKEELKDLTQGRLGTGWLAQVRVYLAASHSLVVKMVLGVDKGLCECHKQRKELF